MVVVVSMFPQLHGPCSPDMAQPYTPVHGQLYDGRLLTRASMQPTLVYKYDSEAQPGHPNPDLGLSIQFP